MKKQTLKNHAAHGFTQYELTQNILNNLSQFDITPTAKLVLLYLSSCYNPKNADMFPKQKTIATKLGVSERSIVRAIQELFKAGLIMIECKYTNRYKFTSKIAAQRFQNDKKIYTDNMSENKCQNGSQQNDNLAQHEQTIKEQNKKPQSVEDYKLLKEYAQKHGAKNIKAYIEALQRNGSAEKIIETEKQKAKIAARALNEKNKTQELLNEYRQQSTDLVSPLELRAMREKLLKRG